jgi:hypothetical protein
MTKHQLSQWSRDGSDPYFAFLCAFTSLRESLSYERGWFTPRRKVAKQRKVKLGLPLHVTFRFGISYSHRVSARRPT